MALSFSRPLRRSRLKTGCRQDCLSYKKTALLFLVLAGCGYIGEPQYPALNIPNRITDLTAIERGDHIQISFTIPALTTEGMVVTSVGAIDLRAGFTAPGSFNAPQWAESAKRFDVPVPSKPGPVQATIPVKDFIDHGLVIGVRLANRKERVSDWSNFVTVAVTAPLTTPTNLTGKAVPEGVLLAWDGPGQSFKIFRASDQQPQPAPVATAEERQYLDNTTKYGQKYEYYVQALNGATESDAAGPFTITPKDTFPPAAPANVAATSGIDSIELAWDRNTETDFKGYRVYRSLGDSAFEVIAALIDAPAYSDRKVESGKRYRYAVSALDQQGNESAKSPVEATAP